MKTFLLRLTFTIGIITLLMGEKVNAQFGNTFSVTNTNDSGPGSLRQAILDVNRFMGTIQFNLGMFPGSLYLQSPLPVAMYRSPFVASSYISLHIYASTSAAANSDGVTTYDIINGSGGNATITTFGQSGEFVYHNFNAKSFVVTTTQPTGTGSLAQMLQYAQARAVTPYDSIVFNIPGMAPHVIMPTQNYMISSPVIIDGTTQPANGYTGTSPKIELDGNQRSNSYGLFFDKYPSSTGGASGSKVGGLYIHGFKVGIGYSCSSFSIGMPGKGNVVSGNNVAIGNIPADGSYSAWGIGQGDLITIQNNIIGLDPSGAVQANQDGIVFYGDYVSILNNTISGNTAYAIREASYVSFRSGVTGTTIFGNKIGLSTDGNSMIGNGGGISLFNCANITVGGPGNKRNIISGNKNGALDLFSSYSPVTGISITNNYIGTDITGTKNFGNEVAISLYSDSIAAVIGGETLAEGNLIAYNKIGVIAGNSGTLIKNNSFIKNEIAIKNAALYPPVITARSSAAVSGTALANAIVQIYEDDGSNKDQGKTFLAEVPVDANGQWSYTATISNPCRITAICLKPDKYWSSSFSFGSRPDLVPDTLINCNGTEANVKAVNGFSSYSWSDGSANQTLNTAIAGQYIVTVNNGCEYKDTVNILFTEPATVALGNDTSFCNHIPLVLNAGSTPKASYIWSANGTVISTATKSSYAANSSGKYAVQVSIGLCKSSDTIAITAYTTPNIATKAKITKCAGEAYAINKNTLYSYVWSTGDTTSSISVLQPGVYTVIATSPQGCSSAISRDTITISDITIQGNLGNDTTICSLTNYLVKNFSASGANNFNWYKKPIGGTFSNVSTSSSYTMTSSGTYVVRLSNANCTKLDTINVMYYPVPKAALGGDTLVCGTTMTLQSRSNSAGAAYSWSTGSTNTSIPVTSSGEYALEIKYSDNCFSRDTVKISLVNCNAFAGLVYVDKNNNKSYEASDSLLSNQMLQAKSQSGLTYYTKTSNDGSYRFELPSALYTITAARSIQEITVPETKYYNVDAGHAPAQSSFDFAINLPNNDLSLQMTNPATVRLGNEFLTNMTITNNGKTSQRALITLQKDPFLNYISSGVTFISSTATSLQLDGGILAPGHTISFTIRWSFALVQTLTGITVPLSAVLPVDDVPANNTAMNTLRLGYPYDPNHKYVGAQYNPLTETVTEAQKLQYMIEFQNTGTDTAYQVVIVDTLQEQLDPMTFQPGNASAPYTWEMGEGGVVTFTFANIYLPDSNVNQSGSRGFVSFTINHKLSQAGDSVYNEAAILFDLADPVITNRVYYKVPGTQNLQSLFLDPLSGLKYGQEYVMINSGSTSGLPISYAYDGPVRIHGDTLFITGVGNARLEAFQIGNQQYFAADPQYISFEIGKASQQITFAEITDKLLTQGSFDLQASGGNSGNPIVFEVISGPVSINGNVITLIGEGIVELMATQAGNELYEAAESVSRTFQITVVTGVNTRQAVMTTVGPNPFSDYLSVATDYNQAETIYYNFVDMQGNIVYKGTLIKGEKIVTDHLPKGTYILKVYTIEQQLTVQKIIKQ